MQHTKSERNKRIYEMSTVDKIPYSKIADIYGITRSRVGQIIRAEKESKKKKLQKKDVSLRENIVNTFSYLDDEHADILGRKLTSTVRSAVTNVFKYLADKYPVVTMHIFYEMFLALTYNEIMDIHAMGRKRTMLIMEIQDTIKKNRNYYRYKLVSDCTKVF